MIRYIDLSHTLRNEMSVYPGDKPFRLYQDKTVEADGYSNFSVEAGMHVGTHVDGPMHLTEDSTMINAVPIEGLCGRGVLLDVRGEKNIGVREKYDERIQKDDIVLLYTGQDVEFGTEEYYSAHPVIDDTLANLLIEKEIKMLGMDLPSPDRHPFVLHKKMLSKGVLLLENLTNLQSLTGVTEFEVLALPLKVEADSAPARVVARYIFV